MLDNYAVNWFASTNLDLNCNTLGRIRNQFVKAIAENILLPKLVVVITDADIIDAVQYRDYGVSDIYGRLIHWLSAELNKITKIHKDRLPVKAVRCNYPSFVWISPPPKFGVFD